MWLVTLNCNYQLLFYPFPENQSWLLIENPKKQELSSRFVNTKFIKPWRTRTSPFHRLLLCSAVVEMYPNFILVTTRLEKFFFLFNFQKSIGHFLMVSTLSRQHFLRTIAFRTSFLEPTSTARYLTRLPLDDSDESFVCCFFLLGFLRLYHIIGLPTALFVNS